MPDKVQARIAFILSHPFHYQFYAPIARLIERPIFVLEHRAKTPFEFSDDFVQMLDSQVLRIDESELKALDGLVDVIFCMTPKHVLNFFEKSKTAALQYSMAKEVYQYGPWRLQADINLMHGNYSYSRVSGFAVSEIVGNPRYDDVPVAAGGGGGLLYMPTYGELSSLSLFVEALPTLPADLKIKVKLHHASEFADQAHIAALKNDPRIEIIDGYANALDDIAASDIVLSDYSGAIFDALYLKKPIALIQHALEQTIVRTDAESLEVARAADIGPVATTAAEIAGAIDSALNQSEKWNESRTALREEIFSYQGQSATRIMDVISSVLQDKYKPSLPVRQLRETTMRYIVENRALKKKISDKSKLAAVVGVSKKSKAGFNMRLLYLLPYRFIKKRLPWL